MITADTIHSIEYKRQPEAGLDIAAWSVAVALAEAAGDKATLPERVRLYVALDADSPALPAFIDLFQERLAESCELHLLVPRNHPAYALAPSPDVVVSYYPQRADAATLRRALAAQVAACDIVIAPVSTPTTAAILAAALAAGRPVVANRTPDLLALDDAAILVAPGDADAFINEIVALASDPALRAHYADNAHYFAARYFATARAA